MKRFFKILLKILLGLVVVAVIVVGIAFYATSGIVDTADQFFLAVKEKNIPKAYGYLAEEFKAGTDEAALNEFLSQNALLNYKEASWSERSINNGQGVMIGSITTETGGTVPIKLALIKENEVWKIYSIEKTAAGLQTTPAQSNAETEAASGAPAPSVPGKEAQMALVSQSMHDFAVSVNAKDMEHFRKNISELWKQQFSTKKLNEVYEPVIKAKMDLTILDNLEPSIEDGVKLDEKGWIAIKGHYPTKPSKVYFEQEYANENGIWKLTAFNISVK